MKIEAGKYYRTRDGRKVGPMIHNRGNQVWPWVDDEDDPDGCGNAWDPNGLGCFCTPAANKRPGLDLIAEWTDAPDLTAINVPFGLLDDATREALKAELFKPDVRLQFFDGTEWCDSKDRPERNAWMCYRVKPQPPAPREWWVTGGNCIWDTYADAQNACDPGEKPVKVREVT